MRFCKTHRRPGKVPTLSFLGDRLCRCGQLSCAAAQALIWTGAFWCRIQVHLCSKDKSGEAKMQAFCLSSYCLECSLPLTPNFLVIVFLQPLNSAATFVPFT